MSQYSPVSGPDRPLPATWSHWSTTRVYCTFYFYLHTAAGKHQRQKALKRINSIFMLTFCEQLLFFSCQILTEQKMSKCFLHPPLCRNGSQGWQWAEHNLSHPPASADPQRWEAGLDQSEASPGPLWPIRRPLPHLLAYPGLIPPSSVIQKWS